MQTPLKIILTSTPTDSHMWNLIFMELFLQENGHEVINLGACVPKETLYQTMQDHRPDLVVLSSVSGHLFQDATALIISLPLSLKRAGIPFVVGGKLGTSSREMMFQKAKLLKLGYHQVFVGEDALGAFKTYLDEQKKERLAPSLLYVRSTRSA